MKRRICLWLAIAISMMAAAPEPRPDEIARQMMQAMGGEAAWKQANYLRFSFTLNLRGSTKVARAYLWDKQGGRVRLEDKSAEGKFAVVLLNTRDQKGAAYINGQKLEGAEAAGTLKSTYRAFRLDLDWLALPWNWLAPGVHLKYVGEKSVKGQVYDVVEVAVDQPAGAQAVRYNAYVSRESHLMDYCGVSPDTSLWDWKYTTAGHIQLASEHANPDKKAVISMGNVKVMDNPGDAFFTDPARGLSGLK
ncbi:MAG: hypothetical protein ABSG65_12125 [Bryobacteraceae bacterium]|jgi:hypothetical protein